MEAAEASPALTGRQIRAGGAVAHSPAGLAHLLWHRHRFAGRFERVLAAAHQLWALPPGAFEREVSLAMQTEYTAGFCTECGQGFRQYLWCNSDACKWQPSDKSPVVTWPTEIEVALHKQQITFDDPPSTPQPPPQTGWI